MDEEEESGFTFVDKRRTGEADSENPTPDESNSTEVPDIPEENPSARAGGGSPFQLPHLKTTDRILMSINWLHEGAWIALGLIKDPATEKIEQDLDGARAAIDCIAYLVSKVEPSLGEAEQRELRNLVRDLQLNFVQQQSRAAQA